MRKDHFKTVLQQALHNLYNIPALETSPLVSLLSKKPESSSQSGGRRLQVEIRNAIEQLRPDSTIQAASPAWRTYEILQQRFVEGLIVKEMESRLTLGGRQIRREVHRAVDTLSDYLWIRWGLQDETQWQSSRSEDAADRSADSSLVRFVAQPQPQLIRNVCASVLGILNHLQKSSPQQIQTNLPDDLPYVLVDRSLFRQVLLTTLDKAIESLPGQPIQLNAEARSGEVILSIITGPLMPDWDVPELFSLTELLNQNGVEVNRTVWSGDCFCLSFSLPVTQAHSILLIDDDEDSLHLYKRFLSGQPYHVICVKESLTAVDIAEQEQPTLIFLDVLLPNIDGWEVLQSLKTNPATRHIPVIICSALYKPEIASSLGADDFIKKPLIQKVFFDMLQKWL